MAINYQSVDIMVSGIAEKYPERIAIKEKDKEISYAELEMNSNKMANAIHRIVVRDQVKGGHERLDVKGNGGVQGQSDPVMIKIMIIMERSSELIESILGVLKCGMIFVPVDPAYPGKRVRQLIEETAPQLIVTTGEYRDKYIEEISEGIGGAEIEVLLVEGKGKGIGMGIGKVREERGELEFERVQNRYCYVYFTSGSTGVPKGVLGRSKSLSHFINWEVQEFGIDEEFCFSQLTSPSFDPYLRDIFVPLVAGACICIPERDVLMNPVKLVRWIEEEGIHVIHTVPSLFRAIMSEVEIEDRHRLGSVKYVLLAGEMLKGRDIKKCIGLFGNRIQLVNIYGPTETTLAKMFYRVQPEDVNKTIIPVGKAIQGAQVMILNENLGQTAIGNIGEVFIRTPYITSGYFNNKEMNKKVFLKNPFSEEENKNDIIYKTGDLGKQLPDGNVLLVGRADGMVKIRGLGLKQRKLRTGSRSLIL